MSGAEFAEKTRRETAGVTAMVGASAAEACAEREAERKRKEKKRQKEMLMEPSNETAPTPGQYSCLGLAIRMASGLS